MLASGVTAIAGFAVLIASDIAMLRDFGFVTVIDLAVALLGVMVVLPAALAWSEGAMRDRYSIAVGLLFLALIAIAFFHTIGASEPAPSGSKSFPPAGRSRSSRCRPPPAPSKGTPTSPRTTAKPPRSPARPALAAPPPAASTSPGRSASATSSTARW